MHRKLIPWIVLLALAFAAHGASAADRTTIGFGISGGNIPSYGVTIRSDGSVRTTGSPPHVRRQIAVGSVRRLRNEIQGAHLVSRRCPRVLPDFATHYIRLGGRTVSVHGTCEARFQRVWNDLWRAVARRSG